MDQVDDNKRTKSLVILFMVLNPTLVVVLAVLGHFDYYKTVTFIMGVFSLGVAIIVLCCGRIFRKSLGEYFSGNYISNVAKY